MRLKLLLAFILAWAIISGSINWPEDIQKFDYVGYFTKQYAKRHD